MPSRVFGGGDPPNSVLTALPFGLADRSGHRPRFSGGVLRARMAPHSVTEGPTILSVLSSSTASPQCGLLPSWLGQKGGLVVKSDERGRIGQAHYPFHPFLNSSQHRM